MSRRGRPASTTTTSESDSAGHGASGEAGERLFELLGLFSSVVTSGLALREMLDAFVDSVLTLTHMDAGAVYLLDPNDGLLHLKSHHGFSEAYLAAMETVVPGRGFSGRAVQSQEVRVSQSRQSDSRFIRRASANEGFQSFVSVPLVSRTEPGVAQGVLNLAARSEVSLPRSVVHQLRLMSNYVGQMLIHYRSARLLESRERWLSGLYGIAVEIGTLHDPAQICRLVVDEARLVFDCDNCVVSIGLDECQQQAFAFAGGDEETARQMVSPLRALLSRDPTSITLNGPVLEQILGNGEAAHAIRSLCVAPVRFGDRQPYGLIAIAYGQPRDLSQEQQALNQLSIQLSAALRNADLYQTVEELAAVKERSWISREMHDTLAQLLGICRMEIYHSNTAVKAGQPEQALEHLAKVDELVGQAYDELRDLMLGLRTPVGHGQFIDAIKSYLAFYERQSGVHVISQLPVHTELPSALEVQVVRIIQEALANVRRHAHATQVIVQLTLRPERLLLSIRDNGVGFDPDHLPLDSPRFGIQVMRERANAIGAWLTVQSSPGSGAEVRGEFPLNHSEGTATPAGPVSATGY